MPTTWSALYLGDYNSIDTREGNNRAEAAANLTNRTFGSQNNPLHEDEVSIQTYDGGGYNGVIDMDNDNGSYDWFYTDIGDGPRWYRFDGVATYEATVTYDDGSTANTVVVIFQDTSGNTFLAPSLDGQANEVLNAAPIVSLRLNRVDGRDYSGLQANREEDVFACFAAGTLIDTPEGPRFVETLRAGDTVLTLDDGPQPLAWVGGRRMPGDDAFAPILFEAGAIGNLRDLYVSPQHRMLVTGWRAELHFGQDEVLVPAKGLVNDRDVRVAPCESVSYHHLLFDRHQIVMAEGVASESFHPGRDLLLADRAIHAELTAIFPELAEPGFAAPYPTARPCIKPREGRLLAA